MLGGGITQGMNGVGAHGGATKEEGNEPLCSVSWGGGQKLTMFLAAEAHGSGMPPTDVLNSLVMAQSVMSTQSHS
mgnify:CR=1 FL=1